ncbi:DUF302 domain-containing protein [Ornithinimicrobium avium]|uniref:DUF302 domain-containing protein n=1 Tax=Ornithinimicrobium avium TaxID=2283195 RepID=A0A345NQ04_9MICO|nr:DUF302 domain-containing protein [Ornithinimicrobium avium]AXH97112.1 DUF302 domain-containing protein [Ornithinimicrobium avium]
MDYAMSTTVKRPFADTLEATRNALVDQGFGVLTEIDMAATLRTKLGADIPEQVILGACRPALALAAVRAEPSVGVLLPCNVVVRAVDDTTVVEAMDPDVMVTMTSNDDLTGVASEARQRLSAALASLGTPDVA